MKRIYILWLLLFCLVLTACGANAELPIEIPGVTQSNVNLEENSVPDVSAPSTTASNIDNSTTKATKKTTETTAKKATKTTRYDEDANITYRDVEPYRLPVANPDKGIYNKPNGTQVDTFSDIGYYTIVEEARDKQGYTWGRLSNGEGWTLVYFDVLPELELWFGSGVGAWGTQLSITGKGAFSGCYRDTNAGDMDDAHPNGTCYICEFTGAFAITDIGTYTVSLKMTDLDLKPLKGSEWIEDGVLYISSSAHGLQGQSEFVLYTPNTPIEALPEDAYAWNPPEFDGDTIGCYALYALGEGFTFFSE